MRLLTFAYEPGGSHQVDMLVPGERVLVIGRCAKRSARALAFDASDMVSLIAAGPRGLDTVRQLAAGATDADVAPWTASTCWRPSLGLVRMSSALA